MAYVRTVLPGCKCIFVRVQWTCTYVRVYVCSCILYMYVQLGTWCLYYGCTYVCTYVNMYPYLQYTPYMYSTVRTICTSVPTDSSLYILCTHVLCSMYCIDVLQPASVSSLTHTEAAFSMPSECVIVSLDIT